MDELVEEVLLRLPPSLMDELVEEVLLRLPPDEPAWLVRASAVCKPWRLILAAPRFRRRYLEFHRTPPLLGYFEDEGHFVPTSPLFPALPDRPGWNAIDCRHGRVLFIPCVWKPDETFQLLVLDPVTGHGRRISSPVPVDFMVRFRVAVLCSAHGCVHHSCQGGHFRVAFVAVNQEDGFTSSCLYSSETGSWSKPTSLHSSNVKYSLPNSGGPSILVRDALYFNINGIIKLELGTLWLSMFDEPVNGHGSLMTTEDGGLGFAAVVDSNLTLWSRDDGPDGDAGWTKLRIINLHTLIPDAFSISTSYFRIGSSPRAWVSGFAEGTHVIFVDTYVGFYMVNLKSGRVRKVSTAPGISFFPYMNFYIPEMEAASTG